MPMMFSGKKEYTKNILYNSNRNRIKWISILINQIKKEIEMFYSIFFKILIYLCTTIQFVLS